MPSATLLLLDLTLFVWAVATGSAQSTTSAVDVPLPPACTLTDANQCDLDGLPASPEDGSAVIYPGGNTRCAYDDFSDASTNFSANATYFFQVFPASKSPKANTTTAAKDKLVLFFQDGGACVDDLTCSFALQCSVQPLFSTKARAYNSGVFNRSAPANPFADWNLINLPYCTGDLHIGNVVRDGDSSMLEAFDMATPTCVANKRPIHQNGYNNTMAVLTWAKRNFPAPQQIVVAGASAGSLAAQMYVRLVADLWEVEARGIALGVLADSYVGVTPADKPGGQVFRYYGACDVDLKLPAAIDAECDTGNLTVVEMVSAVMTSLPNSHWLFLTSQADVVQRIFYELLAKGAFAYPFKDLLAPDAFFAKVKTMVAAYQQANAHVTTSFVASDEHMFVVLDRLYTEQNASNVSLLGNVNQWTQSLAKSAASANSFTTNGSDQQPTEASRAGDAAGSIKSDGISSSRRATSACWMTTMLVLWLALNGRL